MCKNPGEQAQQGGHCGPDQVCFGGDSTKYGEPEWNKAALCAEVICYCENRNNPDNGMNGIICKNVKKGEEQEKSYCSTGEVCVGSDNILSGVAEWNKPTLCR